MKKNLIKSKSEISVKNALDIEESTWIDVRCPREFLRGHFTYAINIPIFNDSEYEELGIAYRSKGQKEAIQLGEDYAKKSSMDILNQISKLDSQNFIIGREKRRVYRSDE